MDSELRAWMIAELDDALAELDAQNRFWRSTVVVLQAPAVDIDQALRPYTAIAKRLKALRATLERGDRLGLTVLDLPTQFDHALRDAGLVSVEQVALRLRDGELEAVPGIGEKAVQTVEAKLKKLGLLHPPIPEKKP